MQKCKKCGYDNYYDGKLCGSCGAPLPHKKGGKHTSTSKKTKPPKGWKSSWSF